MPKNTTPAMSKNTATPEKQGTPKKRHVRLGGYSSFKLQKRMTKQVGRKLPSAFQIFKDSLAILWQHKKLFLGIIAVYGVINFVVVQGFGSVHDITGLKTQAGSALADAGRIGSGFAIFAYLLGNVSSTSASTSASGSSYGAIWLLIASLALIWTLRQVYSQNKEKIRIRDGFYSGVYPLVPFVLILMVIIIQLLPLVAASVVVGILSNNGIITTIAEGVVWGALLFVCATLSIYWASSSVFAMYIACLPDMTPMRALRSAGQLVFERRWAIIRKVLFLPFIVLVIGALVMVPIIIFAAPVAGWIFFILTMLALAVMHSYYYALYRSLL